MNGVQNKVPATTTGRVSNTAAHGDHHSAGIFNHKHDNIPGQGVYVPTKRLDEWKTGGVALLSGSLLDLEVRDQTEEEKDRTWWEAGNTGSRRRSSIKQRKAEAYDGEYDDNGMQLQYQPSFPGECEGCISERVARENAFKLRTQQFAGHQKRNWVRRRAGREGKEESPDEELSAPRLPSFLSPDPNLSPDYISSPSIKPHSLTCEVRTIRVRPDIAPTRFKPPLFLKSGPMLRYCGVRNENIKSRSNRNKVTPNREIWRGSIMIVSQDQHSSYELAPTLRLFLQPVELLPPPPAQVDGGIDDLAPEYVDPLAGLPKLGRDGRTLYIRPIVSSGNVSLRNLERPEFLAV